MTCVFVVLSSACASDRAGPASVDGAHGAVTTAWTRVTLSPAPATVSVGSKVTFTVTAYDASGNVVPGPIGCGWSSDKSAIATVSAGVATGVSLGTALIKAGCSGIIGTAYLTVVRPAAASVTVTPTSDALKVAGTQQFTATARDSAGNVLTGVPVTWASSAQSVAQVNGSGLVAAVGAGTATITATVDAQSVAAAVTVRPQAAALAVSPGTSALLVGGTQQLTATPTDSAGNPIAGDTVTWSSSAPSVASVSAGGVVTALASGSAAITAMVDGQTAIASVTVRAAAASVTLTPTTAAMLVGGTQQLSASALDGLGNVILGAPITWSSSAPAVATVSANGLVTALAAGTVTISAAVDGQSATSAVSVRAVAASVSVSPASASVQPGATQQLSATARDGSGNPIAGAPVSWSSSAPSVATVSAGGLVNALAAGSATITATVDGQSGAAAIAVPAPATLGPLARVVLSPATPTIVVGGTVTFAVTGYDAAGNLLPGPIGCGWSSDHTSVATVSAGVARGVATGTSIIKAGCSGIVGTATLTVVSATVTLAASVSVSPGSASLQVGGTQQLTATARDSAGNTLSGRPVTWSSNNTALATVSSSGLVTAVAAGTVCIVATVDGKTATSTVTVAAAPPPPPPGPPAALMFSDDFENGYAPSVNGAGWQSTTATNISLSTDVAHSGSSSMKFTYPGKADCLDASAEERFSFGRPMQEIWLEWYIYYPAGGEGGSATYYHRWEYPNCTSANQTDNNKFLALFGPTYQKEPTLFLQTWTTTLAMSVPPTAPGDSRIQTAATTAGGGGAAPGYANYMNFISGSADRGRWIQIRLHARVADFGVNNGVAEVWKDGVKILCNTTLPWYDSSNTANYLTQGYLLGWADSGYSQTTNIYIDDFKIIGQNPGW